MHAHQIKRLFRNTVVIAINKGFVKHTTPPSNLVILKSKTTEDGLGWTLKVPGEHIYLDIINGEMYVTTVSKYKEYTTRVTLEDYVRRMDENICPWSHEVMTTNVKKMKYLVKVISKKHKTKTLSKHQETELDYAYL